MTADEEQTFPVPDVPIWAFGAECRRYSKNFQTCVGWAYLGHIAGYLCKMLVDASESQLRVEL